MNRNLLINTIVESTERLSHFLTVAYDRHLRDQHKPKFSQFQARDSSYFFQEIDSLSIPGVI